MSEATEQLRNHQTQLDMDGIMVGVSRQAIDECLYEIDLQAARIAALEDALKWYGEQARLCRLITSEGDPGRRALDADGGARARAALAQGG